jgi:toxin FitB
MKFLVDTCGWIEWITNGKLAHLFEPYLIKPIHLIIPTLIQYELYKWICREKNIQMALEVIGITESGIVVPLETNLALFSVDIAKEFGLAMADAIIYASCKQHECLLVTSDKHFKSLPHVKFFEK